MQYFLLFFKYPRKWKSRGLKTNIKNKLTNDIFIIIIDSLKYSQVYIILLWDFTFRIKILPASNQTWYVVYIQYVSVPTVLFSLDKVFVSWTRL